MINIGQVINEKFIDEIELKILEKGYEDGGHWCSKFFCEWYSADCDEDGNFYESMQHIMGRSWFSHRWERDWEYEHVQSKVDGFIASRLEEEGFYKFPYKFGDKLITPKLNIDMTQCGFHKKLEPTIVSERNIEEIEYCLNNAVNDVTWAISESYQLFLQTTNPCCWDSKPPRKRYGNGWIADNVTRLINMEFADRIDEMKFKRCLYRRHTLRLDGPYHITEYDRNGEEYEYS